MAEKLKDTDIDVIVGPAMGGIVYAYELGRQLGKRAIFTERVDNVMTLKRFAIHPGERCIIAEDVVTTGVPAWKQARHRRSRRYLPGHHLRGGPYPPRSSIPDPHPGQCLKLDLPNYAPEECPICKEGKLPLVHLGSRKMKEAAKQTL